MGAAVGSGITDSMGNFSISISDYSGPLMLQASGGTYTDEATGTTMTMQTGDVMACAIPSVAAGATTSGIQITPVTSMAHSRVHHMTGGITAANITTANNAMGAYFSVSDILHTVPMNPLVTGSGTGTSQDAKNYGMAIAAMSQYAMSIGMPHSSGIVTAMMDDALKVVERSRRLPREQQFVWTLPGWPMSTIAEAWPGHTEARRQQFRTGRGRQG